jgi:hypothetical protein
MNSDSTITLDVSGVAFRTKKSNLMRAGYFAGAFALCTEVEQPIFVDRSAKAFVHVLEYLRNERHIVPLKYRFELDFYDIKYETKGLVVYVEGIYVEIERELIAKMKALEKQVREYNDYIRVDMPYKSFFRICESTRKTREIKSCDLMYAKRLGIARFQDLYAISLLDGKFFLLTREEMRKSRKLTEYFRNSSETVFHCDGDSEILGVIINHLRGDIRAIPEKCLPLAKKLGIDCNYW